ncbi:MAG: LysR family transcriptional regulator, partial [Lacisediminimonas sp.]|nr:LysR family transcriptional regulator [Lacisediminimonas sp.]
MDLKQLAFFVLAAELGSLSRAAAALGIAQSAMSRNVSALESELSGRLFYRTGRGMSLTELG